MSWEYATTPRFRGSFPKKIMDPGAGKTPLSLGFLQGFWEKRIFRVVFLW